MPSQENYIVHDGKFVAQCMFPCFVGLGTGPGVIQVDGYVPNYNNNKQRNQQNQGRSARTDVYGVKINEAHS